MGGRGLSEVGLARGQAHTQVCAKATRLLRDKPGAELSYDHVVVDEAQDLHRRSGARCGSWPLMDPTAVKRAPRQR